MTAKEFVLNNHTLGPKALAEKAQQEGLALTAAYAGHLRCVLGLSRERRRFTGDVVRHDLPLVTDPLRAAVDRFAAEVTRLVREEALAKLRAL